MKPTGVSLQVGGSACDEYVVEKTPNLTTNCWVDPNQDHLIRRVRKQKNNQLSSQLDIRYRQNDEHVWYPASWENNDYTASGSLEKSRTVEVLQIRLNEAQPPDLFSVRYPPGTEVDDLRVEKTYHVQTDGTMREFSLATGEDLPGTAFQPGTPWYEQHKWLLVTVGIVLVAFTTLAFLWWKRWRVRS